MRLCFSGASVWLDSAPEGHETLASDFRRPSHAALQTVMFGPMMSQFCLACGELLGEHRAIVVETGRLAAVFVLGKRFLEPGREPAELRLQDENLFRERIDELGHNPVHLAAGRGERVRTEELSRVGHTLARG